ncbi:hypothetical protein D3C87_2043190 [compost metagenome]
MPVGGGKIGQHGGTGGAAEQELPGAATLRYGRTVGKIEVALSIHMHIDDVFRHVADFRFVPKAGKG